MLFADFFVRFAIEAGFDLSKEGRGWSDQQYTIGTVTAKFLSAEPYLEFSCTDQSKAQMVQSAVSKAHAHVGALLHGQPSNLQVVWYSAKLSEQPFSFNTPFDGGSSLVMRLQLQWNFVGWLTLGDMVLVECVPIAPNGEAAPPVMSVNLPVSITVHVGVRAPRAGYFSDHLAHTVVETAVAICSFATMRSLRPPGGLFPAEAGSIPDLTAHLTDPKMQRLARRGHSVAIFETIGRPGGQEYLRRLRAALLTFDAALSTEHEDIACMLYVVAAECLMSLSKQEAPWRDNRLTARFLWFFEMLMSTDLDVLVAHGNFETTFGIKRGKKKATTLRKHLLNEIYEFRSQLVHAGRRQSYSPFSEVMESRSARRGIFAEFAEMAIIRYIESPRTGIDGHPNLALDDDPSILPKRGG